MEADKRIHKRICPEGLIAHLIIDPMPPGEEILLDGEVMDMSYSGIKIKLNRPLTQDFQQAELKISIILPESGVTVSIRGIIRHVQKSHECGFQYDCQHTEEDLDSLMFECVKYATH